MLSKGSVNASCGREQEERQKTIVLSTRQMLDETLPRFSFPTFIPPCLLFTPLPDGHGHVGPALAANLGPRAAGADVVVVR